MSRATRTASEIRGGYFGNAAAYVLGVPLAMGLLYAIDSGMIGNAEVQRYTQFAVQKTAVVLFCCAMCGLGGKLVRFRSGIAVGRVKSGNWTGAAAMATIGMSTLGHIAVARAARIKLALPRGVRETFPEDAPIVIETLWRLGDAIE